MSLNDICLCPCPVLIPYVYKLYSFTKLEISMLIPSNILSFFDDSLEPDLILCFVWCSQPIVLVAYTWTVKALTGQI